MARFPTVIDDFRNDPQQRWHPYRLIHDINGNVLEIISYPYPETPEPGTDLRCDVKVREPGDPTTLRTITLCQDGEALPYRPVMVRCERDQTIFSPRTHESTAPPPQDRAYIDCPTCGRGYYYSPEAKAWNSDRRLTIILTPIIGMGVTFGVGSDRYPGTIIRISPSGKTFYFTRDDFKRTDNRGLSEMQDYEYTPRPDGSEYTVRFNKAKAAWMHEGRYVGMGFRRAYYDPHF